MIANTRKFYSIEASEGEFYIGGFVLLTFIEQVTKKHKRNWLNEFQQYKTSYVELTFVSSNAVELSTKINKSTWLLYYGLRPLISHLLISLSHLQNSYHTYKLCNFFGSKYDKGWNNCGYLKG